ncbi:hypothetical protein GIB67_015420 [Kingdonia uniflora]|uniref:Uncharacterized protein n=1 Tax=Kingdonia uniflora TaxID=39325 RepID=A0A7J7KZ08_9MAGN|nr:hypothetical protein GIB67_015420 [Kingdonia uniflora]
MVDYVALENASSETIGDVPLTNATSETIGDDAPISIAPSAPVAAQEAMGFIVMYASYTENAYDINKSLVAKLRKDPNYKPYAIVGDMHDRYGVEITYWIGWNAKNKVLAEEIKAVDPDFFSDVKIEGDRFQRYGICYTNHFESQNAVILRVRNIPIYVFIEKMCKICTDYTLERKEAAMSEGYYTIWA